MLQSIFPAPIKKRFRAWRRDRPGQERGCLTRPSSTFEISPPSSGLFALPPEIRRQIWREVIAGRQIHWRNFNGKRLCGSECWRPGACSHHSSCSYTITRDGLGGAKYYQALWEKRKKILPMGVLPLLLTARQM